MPLALRALLPTSKDERGARSKQAAAANTKAAGHGVLTTISTTASGNADHRTIELHRALRSFHLLLRSERLYEKNHPCRLDSLVSAYDSLRQISETLQGLEIR